MISSSHAVRIASFLAVSAFLFVSPNAYSFNPFSLKKEFDEKLTSQQLLASTKFYSQGISFQKGQSWSEDQFKNKLSQYNFRLRAPGQILMPEDAVQLNFDDCKKQIKYNFEDFSDKNLSCWKWKNKINPEMQLIITDSDHVIESFTGEPLQPALKASFDPQLVAQYKNNEPLIQDEKKLSEFPVACLNAVIAIEDNDFLDHSGVSYSGLARAIIKNISTLRKAQGGSTITQQLVKNYFLTPEKSYTRKAKEIYMAIRLENEWTKDEILETYLNIIYMGQSNVFQIRGLPAASTTYFNKSIDQLNLAECALLAAIINNPLQNNPWNKKEKALARRNLVLNKMLDLQLINQEQHDTALKYPLPNKNELKATETAPYFFEAVRYQSKQLGIDPEGKSFFTTLDLEFQDKAQKSLSEGIKKATLTRKSLQAKKEKGIELQGSILTADNLSGDILVFVGGQNYRSTQFNRALNSKRQIGSLVKPFIYLTGLVTENYNPTSILADESFTWEYDNKKWKPDNYDKKFRGPVPYYYALKESLNSPTAQVAQKSELKNVIDVMKKAGFKSSIPEIPSLSLGVSEHTPLEVLQAYSTLASLGEYKDLTFIHRIENEDGDILFDHKVEKKSRLPKDYTSELVSMMKQTIQSGTAKSLAFLPFSKFTAGKTGTTSNARDVWFAGFTPQLTTIVWVGYDQNLPTALTGASGAVPIWSQYMKDLSERIEPSDFIWDESVHAKTFEFPELKETPTLMVK